MPEVPVGAAVDVILTLAFVLFVLSVISAAVTELIAGALNWRGRTLRSAVGRLLGEERARQFYAESPVSLLHGPRGRLPSYLPARLFEDEDTFEDLMDRVSGWYKRRIQWTVLLVALLGCAALNADAATIADRVMNDEPLKESVLSRVEKSGETVEATASRVAAVDELALPFGWTDRTTPDDLGGWLGKLAGVMVLAISIPIGASFWFDILSKFSRQRATGVREGDTARDDPDGGDPSSVPGMPSA